MVEKEQRDSDFATVSYENLYFLNPKIVFKYLIDCLPFNIPQSHSNNCFILQLGFNLAGMLPVDYFIEKVVHFEVSDAFYALSFERFCELEEC